MCGSLQVPLEGARLQGWRQLQQMSPLPVEADPLLPGTSPTVEGQGQNGSFGERPLKAIRANLCMGYQDPGGGPEDLFQWLSCQRNLHMRMSRIAAPQLSHGLWPISTGDAFQEPQLATIIAGG